MKKDSWSKFCLGAKIQTQDRPGRKIKYYLLTCPPYLYYILLYYNYYF